MKACGWSMHSPRPPPPTPHFTRPRTGDGIPASSLCPPAWAPAPGMMHGTHSNLGYLVTWQSGPFAFDPQVSINAMATWLGRATCPRAKRHRGVTWPANKSHHHRYQGDAKHLPKPNLSDVSVPTCVRPCVRGCCLRIAPNPLDVGMASTHAPPPVRHTHL